MIDVALRETTVPLPLRATLNGLPEPEKVKFRLAVRCPIPDGVKVKVREQLFQAGTGIPQVEFAWLKSVLFEPVIATVTLSGALVLLVRLTRPVLPPVVPINCVPKITFVGLTKT